MWIRAASLLILLAFSCLVPILWISYDRPANARQKTLAMVSIGLLLLLSSGLAAVLFLPIAELDFCLGPGSMESLGLLGPLSLAANFLGGVKFLLLLTFAMALWEWRAGRGRSAFVILAVVWCEIIACAFLKHLVGRPRPFGPLVHVHDPSFPSGHASNSVLVYGMAFAMLFERAAIARWRAPAIGLFVLFITGMGASRLILRAHWALDVLSGFALGAFWLAQFLLVRHGRWCAGIELPASPPENASTAA